MSGFKKTAAVSAAFSVVAALTVAVGFSTANAAVSTVVKPSSLNGWGVGAESDAAGGSAAFVNGPATPPAGTGSLRFQLNTAASGYAAVMPMAGTPLGDIDELSYDTYRGSSDSGNNLAVALQFNVDYDLGDASSAWQGRIVYEPYNSSPGGVAQGAWQQWDALAGSWWQTGTPVVGGATQAKACPQAAPCSLATLLTAYSDLGVHASPSLGYVILKAGSNWAGFDGNVDNLTVGVNGNSTTYDFEAETPCTTVCYVDAVNGNNTFGGDTASSAKKTIQAAINQVAAGGQIRVLPGTYDETAPNSSLTNGGGTYQFGLFFPSAKPGITLMGVTSGDVPIDDASSTLATITTNATNNFGHSGIFVEAAGTTIQGLEIGRNIPGDNKTIEVVADAFTLRDVDTDIPDGGGSIYINDFSNAGDVVKGYRVLESIFDDGTSVDISSGAGSTGPVSGRQILGNKFDYTSYAGDFWPAISFNGSGTTVPWYANTVGGAEITGNTFAGAEVVYIRSRGNVVDAEFDWKSYWLDNTYDKAAVALSSVAPFTVRDYTYMSGGGYTFPETRRIGATIQGEVDNAVGGVGDTVLVKEGTYPEDVVVNKADLNLVGAGIGLSKVVGPKGNAALTTLEIPASASGVSVEGFTITREGNTATDWNNANGALNNQGVAIYGNGAELKDSKVTANRNGVFLYGAQNVSVHHNTIDNNRTGIHLVNNVTGLSVRNNFITNNWTMGVLFRDESSPNGTGVVTLQDNDISGNWYSQIEARSLFSAPALDMTENWLGTTSPTVVAAASSGEPGYSSQIPDQFVGGFSTPPGGAPTIVWNPVNPSNPVDYIPFQCSGVDTSTAIGFQPVGILYAGGSSQVLPPLEAQAENLVKRGQVVPVHVRVIGCDGLPVNGLAPEIRLFKGDATEINEANDNPVTSSVSSADSGTTMRAVDSRYTYNLRVPSDVTVGAEYTIKIKPYSPTSEADPIYIALRIRK